MVFERLSTPGTSFVQPDPSHASRSRSEVTQAELESARAAISAENFRAVTEGLSQSGHVNTLEDLELYSGVPAASLNLIVEQETLSDGSTRLQLTSLGSDYLRRYGSQ
jgi:hypothetical protein